MVKLDRDRQIITPLLPNSIDADDDAADIQKGYVTLNGVKIAIFCDGSVHDSPERKRQDKIDRDNLQYVVGYSVLSIGYKADLQL